jgi:hypothetical protein
MYIIIYSRKARENATQKITAICLCMFFAVGSRARWVLLGERIFVGKTSFDNSADNKSLDKKHNVTGNEIGVKGP